MDYYGASSIQKITGCKQTFAYDLIRKLQTSFKKEYPEAIVIQGKIPIWYFEKKLLNKGNSNPNEENNCDENKKNT